MSRIQLAFATASIFILFCASIRIAVPSSFAALPSPPPEESQSSEEGQKQSLEFGAKAEESAARSALAEVRAISQGIQALKSQVVDLNKDLRLMEEKLLFPSSTRYTVFVSLKSDRFFDLEGIKFKLDGELVATHVYSEKQRGAMARGGVHRLYVTNLNEGKHTATVFFTGLGSNERPYKRAVSLDFDKGPGSGYLEISVADDASAREPVFDLRQW
ncbi:AraC family transcriptional regulator [Proteobacteria bacterium 005FR1]|nr:AraC family transcriptional regulator [Proteobacteria bacterium 005FR1]